MHPDVVVVGAGVVGAGAAFHLARLGLRARVVERSHPGAGGTGRSAGVIRLYSPLPELAVASLPYYRRWADLVGGRCGFVPCGVVVLLSDRDELLRTVDRVRSAGGAIEALDERGTARLLPGFALDGAAAYEPDSGYADPRLTTTAFLRAAHAAGAEVRRGVSVQRLLVREGVVVGVETSEGRVPAGEVVLAAGPWSVRVARTAGVALPVIAERAQAGVLRAAHSGPAVLDLDLGLLVRRHRLGVLIGASAGPAEFVDPESYRQRADPAFLAAAAARLARRAPHLAEGRWRYGYAGLYDRTPDGRPLIGRVAPGLYVACGFGGAGFKMAPAVGAAIADLVAGRPHPVDLAPYRPDRAVGTPPRPPLAGVPVM